ncbi:MAG: hypothetical protein ACPGU1_10505 [Myxococcota bacterium]
MTKRWLFMVLTASVLAGGCANPCAVIAEKACATAGSESEECTRLQTMASRASTEERRSCEVALNLVESLEKVQ